MQIITGLASLLKRGSSEGECPASRACPGQSGQQSQRLDVPAADPKGRNKKLRLSAPPAAAAAAAVVAPPSALNLQVNALFASAGSRLCTNPLFISHGDEASDGSDSYELVSSSYATTRDGATTSSDTEMENAPPQGSGGGDCGSSPQLAGLVAELGAGSGGGSDSLAAFQRCLLSPLVAGALTALDRGGLHPLSPANLSTTAAGLLVLSRRARLSAQELEEDAQLLTLLWLLESIDSQYREELGLVLRSYLTLLGRASRPPYSALKQRMLRLQMQLLERCSWRVVLHENSEELLAARSELEASPAFRRICAAIAQWAADGWVPPQLGDLGGSGCGGGQGGAALRALGPHNR